MRPTDQSGRLMHAVAHALRRAPAGELDGAAVHAVALPLLGDAPFLAMNSDAIFPPTSPHPVAQLEAAWRDELDFVMLLVEKSCAKGWEGKGDFIVNEAGEIRRHCNHCHRHQQIEPAPPAPVAWAKQSAKQSPNASAAHY